jgi:UDP-2,3-diacylglucosamine pyrophosphatase LpxH
MGNRRIFISDVHIGAGRFGNVSRQKYKYDWDWLSVRETDNFVRFLSYLKGPYMKNIREVVMLGDIFDNWVFPHDLRPPTMDELFLEPKNAGVVKVINELSQRVPVFFVPGNHDLQCTKSVMKRHFPRIIYVPEQFIAGRLVAEHGHRYALFNAPPTFTDSYGSLPLGYFISRIEATKAGLTKSGGRDYKSYVDDFIEMLGPRTLSECVFEAVIEEAGLSERAQFVMRDRVGGSYPLGADEVKAKYKNLFEDWPTNLVSKTRAVFAELDKLGPIADKLCKNGKLKVCVFGHSHEAQIDKDTWFVDDRVYANSGYWCGKQCTFVETEKTGGKTTVSLRKWTPNGTIQTLNKESV